MKINAATRQAMSDMGIPEYAMEEYIQSGSHMSQEMADKCATALNIGQMQHMSDEEYGRLCP